MVPGLVPGAQPPTPASPWEGRGSPQLPLAETPGCGESGPGPARGTQPRRLLLWCFLGLGDSKSFSSHQTRRQAVIFLREASRALKPSDC